jgi:hypothetical protein
MDDKKKDQLEAFLKQIKEHQLEKLVTAVEVDRASGGADLPHETLLDAMRPALRENVHAKRVPTAERLFCVAFEDLLNALPRRRKQIGRISRSSIRPMWNWLREDLLPGDFERVEKEINELIINGERQEADKLVLDLQIAAGDHMHKALEGVVRHDEAFEAFSDRLGGPTIVADLRDMAMCLEVADGIQEIQETFDRPILGFDEDALQHFKRIYSEFRDVKPGHSSYCLFVILGRMARPWEILFAIEALADADDGSHFTEEDQAIIHELLLDDVDVTGLSFIGLRPEDVDHQELMINLDLFVQMTGGVLRGIGMHEDKNRRQRFRTTKDAVAQQMGAFVESMPGLILKALPVKKTGGYGVRIPRVPDTTMVPSHEAVNLSLELTKLFVDMRLFADQGGFGSAYSRAAKEFDHRYDRFKTDILDHIRQANGAELGNARAFAEVLAQIGEIYKGDVEADMIRRRSASAAEEGPIPLEIASSGN